MKWWRAAPRRSGSWSLPDEAAVRARLRGFRDAGLTDLLAAPFVPQSGADTEAALTEKLNWVSRAIQTEQAKSRPVLDVTFDDGRVFAQP